MERWIKHPFMTPLPTWDLAPGFVCEMDFIHLYAYPFIVALFKIQIGRPLLGTESMKIGRFRASWTSSWSRGRAAPRAKSSTSRWRQITSDTWQRSQWQTPARVSSQIICQLIQPFLNCFRILIVHLFCPIFTSFYGPYLYDLRPGWGEGSP